MKIDGSALLVQDVYEVAANNARVELSPAQMEAVAASHSRVQEWGEAKHPIYGVNTGFGELVPVVIPRQHKRDLQENLIRSHSAGGGEPFPDEIVRAIMLARLNCLMKGYSGASPETVLLLKEFLNSGIHPVIPQQGSLGASGDLAPLSHMALALIGGGLVCKDGQVRPTSEVLAEEGLEPLKLGYKGGLTLINGTSAMTGAASIALVRADRLLKLALVAAADFVQCLGGSVGAFDEHGHGLKNHNGQMVVAREMRRLLAGSKLTSNHAGLMQAISDRIGDSDEVTDTGIYLQNAYTLRAIPQILGPVLDTVEFARRLVEEELNSSNDNPLIFDVPDRTFHGAHFHGQYVAIACDCLNIALTEIGVLAERQLDRLVNPNINGSLPPFLAEDRSGLFCGFEGGQYLATSIAAENLDLAAPSSIKSLPSNGSNQDVVSMGTTSARKSLQLCGNVMTIVTSLVAACNQAAHIVGQEKFSAPLLELHSDLSRLVSVYRDERPIYEVLSAVRRFADSERCWKYLDDNVDLNPPARARAV
ncbi:MAG TPA: tyrosine 2,3-aminomutase [Bryobacteraceae bacterium]|nr:tyrosine 2,3-aminomutase [Bryobacteraceae bacterium]